ALLTVPSLPGAAVAALVLQQLAAVATIWTLVTTLGLVTFSAMRGRTFSRRNTRLVGTAGIVGGRGFAAVPFFGHMGANAAVAPARPPATPPGPVTSPAMRGRPSSRRNTRLVGTAGIVGVLGFAAVPFFGNMGANAAFAQLSQGTFDNVIMAVDLFPFVLGAFVAALAGTVFAVGDRLRREAEGLV